VLHRFSSLAWWKHLTHHLGSELDNDAFDRVVTLKVRSTFPFSTSGSRSKVLICTSTFLFYFLLSDWNIPHHLPISTRETSGRRYRVVVVEGSERSGSVRPLSGEGSVRFRSGIGIGRDEEDGEGWAAWEGLDVGEGEEEVDRRWRQECARCLILPNFSCFSFLLESFSFRLDFAFSASSLRTFHSIAREEVKRWKLARGGVAELQLEGRGKKISA